ncbi:hypothetical protein [Nocardioides sp.]|uniref:hypothetical protein n=1 Tax=Nocardioides sp. TaxID=35761 RepID=UPI00262DADB6|nr:hypothetical protein [Nocardioides sp.]MDI6911512.1 hypothetical protein [Nocardioides sp.]
MTINEFNEIYPVRRILPETCWCGAENRRAEDHICGECPEHCELAAHREGRPSPARVRAAAASRPAAA